MSLLKKIIKISLFTALISGFTISARAAEKMNLDQLIHHAVQNNPEAEVARKEVRKAEAAVKEAFGYALPSVDVSANVSRFLQKPKMIFPDFITPIMGNTFGLMLQQGIITEDQMPTFEEGGMMAMEMAMSNNLEAKAQLTQIIFNSTVFEGIGASKIYEDLAQEQFYNKITEVIINVKKAYYGVLLSKEMLEITKSSLKNAEDNLSNLNAMLKEGLVSEYDAMQAEVQVENIRPSILQIENSYKAALDGLKVLLGLDPSVDLKIEGELKTAGYILPDEKETIEKALEGNRTVRTLDYKYQMDKALIQVDRSEYYPSLAGFANYTYTGQADEFGDILGDYSYKSAIVGLSLQWNLFNGNRTQRKIEQSTIVMNQTNDQLKMMKDFITTQVRAKILDIRRVIAQIEVQERNVVMARKTYEIANTRFKEGTAIQLEIQNAENALSRARTNKTQSIYDYLVAQSELEQLIGTIDPKYLRK